MRPVPTLHAAGQPDRETAATTRLCVHPHADQSAPDDEASVPQALSAVRSLADSWLQHDDPAVRAAGVDLDDALAADTGQGASGGAALYFVMPEERGVTQVHAVDRARLDDPRTRALCAGLLGHALRLQDDADPNTPR